MKALFNKEGSGSELKISPAVVYDQSCTKVGDINETSIANFALYRLCSNVEPHIEWYQYVLDFATGTGIYNETILFHGAFSYSSLGFFHFDLAFLVMVWIIYIFSVVLLVYK